MENKFYWIFVGICIGVLICMAVGPSIPWLFVPGL